VVIKQNSLKLACMRRSHEGSQAMQHSKQEVDLNSDILTLLEISGATKKCYPRKALLQFLGHQGPTIGKKTNKG
jgi:hypothetical protein